MPGRDQNMQADTLFRRALKLWMDADPVEAANEAEALLRACETSGLDALAMDAATPNRVTAIITQGKTITEEERRKVFSELARMLELKADATLTAARIAA